MHACARDHDRVHDRAHTLNVLFLNWKIIDFFFAIYFINLIIVYLPSKPLEISKRFAQWRVFLLLAVDGNIIIG